VTRPALAAMASMATRARGTAGRSLLLFVRRISQHRPLAMPDYHLHEVKRDGSIAKRSVVLKCRDDDEAIRQAWQLREGRGVEVWQEGRLVVQLPRDPRWTRRHVPIGV
jgi:hypothetical protein